MRFSNAFPRFSFSSWKAARAENLVRGNVCLIYQMPKAGSQTIEATLRAINYDTPIHRLHSLTATGATYCRNIFGPALAEPWVEASSAFQIREGNKLHHAVFERRVLTSLGYDLPKLDVIVGVREPIGLMLSGLFQLPYVFFRNGAPMNVQECRDLLTLHPRIDSERRACVSHLRQFILDWFDIEMKVTLRFDIFAQPFPQDRGITILENRFARVLVYRFKDFARLCEAIGDFLETPIDGFVEQNIGAKKEFGKQYEAVKNHLRLPRKFVEEQYSARLIRHLYSQAEIDQFIDRWAESA